MKIKFFIKIFSLKDRKSYFMFVIIKYEGIFFFVILYKLNKDV